jgi:hypothetical protein
MKNIYNLILQITVIAALSSCGEPVDITDKINLNSYNEKLVIFGVIDNNPDDQDTIRLSKTKPVKTAGDYTYIDNATVILSDNQGMIDTLEFYSKGQYLTPMGFAGQHDNRNYHLQVFVEGKSYEANSTMPALRKGIPADQVIDSLTYYYKEADAFEKEGYRVKMYTGDPADENNFYLIKVFQNGKLLNADNDGNVNQVYVSDDQLLSSSIQGVDIPAVFKLNDKVKIVIYALNRESFNFYNDLTKQINNDGGLFGTPPANVIGNINNGALGLFQVSSVAEKSITIK